LRSAEQVAAPARSRPLPRRLPRRGGIGVLPRLRPSGAAQPVRPDATVARGGAERESRAGHRVPLRRGTAGWAPGRALHRAISRVPARPAAVVLPPAVGPL